MFASVPGRPGRSRQSCKPPSRRKVRPLGRTGQLGWQPVNISRSRSSFTDAVPRPVRRTCTFKPWMCRSLAPFSRSSSDCPVCGRWWFSQAPGLADCHFGPAPHRQARRPWPATASSAGLMSPRSDQGVHDRVFVCGNTRRCRCWRSCCSGFVSSWNACGLDRSLARPPSIPWPRSPRRVQIGGLDDHSRRFAPWPRQTVPSVS